MEDLINKIIQNPLFLRLKNVVENGPYHNHEDVYSHVIKVKDKALKEIDADFIDNLEAKDKFNAFITEDLHGFKRGDLMVLIALVHDIGKILSVKDGNQLRPILVTNEKGQTFCPGHEHWGSTIVGEVLEEFSLPKEVTDYIAAVIRNHDTFNPLYFDSKASLTFDLLINDVKSRAEGFYIEALFNVYCDCFDAAPFKSAKDMIVRIFNEPKLYERQEYVVP